MEMEIGEMSSILLLLLCSYFEAEECGGNGRAGKISAACAVLLRHRGLARYGEEDDQMSSRGGKIDIRISDEG
jgi:hypothetical protein